MVCKRTLRTVECLQIPLLLPPSLPPPLLPSFLLPFFLLPPLLLPALLLAAAAAVSYLFSFYNRFSDRN
jgi:hypothetical protein